MPSALEILRSDPRLGFFLPVSTSEMNVLENTMGLYAHRTSAYRNYSFEPMPEERVFAKLEPVLEAKELYDRKGDYWDAHRQEGDQNEGFTVATMLEEMRTVPLFYYGEKVLTMLFKGYVPIGNKPYEENKTLIGPLNSTVSHNSFEGWRFRTGGITTSNLNPHLFGFGYVAYGEKDQEGCPAR